MTYLKNDRVTWPITTQPPSF